MSPVVRPAGRTRASVAATIVVALLGVAAMLVARAPANWLALQLADRTHGVVLLADADGTIWSGSAVLGLGAPLVDGVVAADARRLALPGRVTWHLEITRALAPVLHLEHDEVLLRPLAIRYVDGAVTLDDGTIALPAAMLQLAGAPLNSLLPDGRASLQWTGLRFASSGPPSGEGTLRVTDFSLALSPVRPLGDYLVAWTSGPSGLTWRLGTERGPLELEGNGSLLGRRGTVRIAVRVARDAPPATGAQLITLLDLIGRRGSNEAIIESKAQ